MCNRREKFAPVLYQRKIMRETKKNSTVESIKKHLALKIHLTNEWPQSWGYTTEPRGLETSTERTKLKDIFTLPKKRGAIEEEEEFEKTLISSKWLITVEKSIWGIYI